MNGREDDSDELKKGGRYPSSIDLSPASPSPIKTPKPEPESQDG